MRPVADRSCGAPAGARPAAWRTSTRSRCAGGSPPAPSDRSRSGSFSLPGSGVPPMRNCAISVSIPFECTRPLQAAVDRVEVADRAARRRRAGDHSLGRVWVDVGLGIRLGVVLVLVVEPARGRGELIERDPRRGLQLDLRGTLVRLVRTATCARSAASSRARLRPHPVLRRGRSVDSLYFASTASKASAIPSTVALVALGDDELDIAPAAGSSSAVPRTFRRYRTPRARQAAWSWSPASGSPS